MSCAEGTRAQSLSFPLEHRVLSCHSRFGLNVTSSSKAIFPCSPSSSNSPASIFSWPMSPVYFKALNSVCSSFLPASCQDQLPEAETMVLLSRQVSGASSPSHRQSCGMAELQACPLCSFQSYRLLMCILCLGTLQRHRRQSNRDTQIAPTTSMALARSSQGLGSYQSHRTISSATGYSSESVSTSPIDTASWGQRPWPSLCHDIALFPEQAPGSPQFSKLPLAQDLI